MASSAREQRPRVLSAGRDLPCQGRHRAVPSTATLLCHAPVRRSGVPDRKDRAPRGEASAILRGRRSGPTGPLERRAASSGRVWHFGTGAGARRGGCHVSSARGLSWLIKGEVGLEVDPPSLAISKRPVASRRAACPRCPVGAYKGKGQNPGRQRPGTPFQPPVSPSAKWTAPPRGSPKKCV